MKNISWGTRIAILYISFIGLVVFMVVMSVRQKIDLVSDDYYNQELAFQDKLNKMKNAETLTTTITHKITSSDIELQFQPEFKNKKLTGEILFFRPSDSSKDFKTEVTVNENAQQKIQLNHLSKGMYKMQITWKDETTPYFAEETIVIP